VAASVVLPAQARDEDGDFTIAGVGSTVCREFIRNTKRDGSVTMGAVYMSWALGYLTAINQWDKNNRSNSVPLDNIAFMGEVRKWCNSHRDEQLIDAVVETIDRYTEKH
jgi:hypothetical protein